MRHVLLTCLLSLCATGVIVAGESATTPAPGPVKQAPLAPKITVKAFLDKLPGTWSGMQYTQNPKSQVMSIHVKESYRWVKGAPGQPDTLVGDITYTIKADSGSRVFKGVSRTWIDKDGKGRSEVEQQGAKARFIAQISVDTLVFIPEEEINNPKSMTSVHLIKEGDTESMEVRGFQNTAEGTYLIKGVLKRGENPVVVEAGK